MKYTIDTDGGLLVLNEKGDTREFDLYSNDAFEVLSDLWLKVGWNQKHIYTFSWLGRPIIQLPQDMVRIQEVIHRVRPDVILETGIAHGGGLVFYASICKALGHGRVIGVDVDIRSHNRRALETHDLFDHITLVEGDSVDPVIVDEVKSHVDPSENSLVVLDSDHSADHVHAELEAYHDLVGPESYIIACDGIMELVADTTKAGSDWATDNPIQAVDRFLEAHPEFENAPPEPAFNESSLEFDVTHWPRGWLRRKK